MKKYNKENIPLAKELRKNMTPWEKKLWYRFLRNYPIRNIKFIENSRLTRYNILLTLNDR